jgi:hypothetical protein
MTSTTYIIGPRAVRVAYLPITMFVVENESQLFDVVNQTSSRTFSDKGIVDHCASNYTK